MAMLRAAAALVDKILRDVKPADIPIEQPAELAWGIGPEKLYRYAKKDLPRRADRAQSVGA